MSKARKFIELISNEQGSIASLGAIPSPAIGIVTRPGKSYKLKIPMITKKKRKKKKEGIRGRKIYNQGKEYDIDIGPGKKTLAGAFGTPR